MSHLGNTISRLLSERKDINASSVAEKSGLDRSFLSKIISGRVGVSQETVASIALVIGRTAEERTEIVIAHMKDQSCGYYPDFVNVIPAKKSNGHNSDLHPDIEYLQKHLSNPGIQKSVRGIVELHSKSSNKKSNTQK